MVVDADRVPAVGDDAGGVRALSASLDTIARDGVEPLAETVALLDQVSAGGRIDLQVLDRLGPPVHEARAAFDVAAADVDDVDTSGFTGGIRTRFEEYVDLVTEADRLLASGEKATEVLPAMVGGDGPRDYLLVFQDNAEIRATGGVPWFWSRVHAAGGRLTMEERGTDNAFPVRAQPFALSPGERRVYGDYLGTSFRAAGFTPDFPRAAALLAAHWKSRGAGPPLDGVIALDPVAMSYLLRGTGPVHAGETVLRPGNVVRELLSVPYRTLTVDEQDVLFRRAGQGIFRASTGRLPDPVDFFRGMHRAAVEGRLLVAPFDKTEQQRLTGSRARGALVVDDGSTPHVDIGLNDASGSKLSYYLRYSTDVRASGCQNGQQVIVGSLDLTQQITRSQAAILPIAVSGQGSVVTQVGRQLVRVRIYGPFGGDITNLRVNLERQEGIKPVNLGGRPVVTLPLTIEPQEKIEVSWTATSGRGQTGDVVVGVTPSIVPGPSSYVASSAC